MKRRAVKIRVTDHAVVRYLERGLGVDVAALRAHLAGLALNAAELAATGCKINGVKLVVDSDGHTDADGAHYVRIPTVIYDVPLFGQLKRRGSLRGSSPRAVSHHEGKRDCADQADQPSATFGRASAAKPRSGDSVRTSKDE